MRRNVAASTWMVGLAFCLAARVHGQATTQPAGGDTSDSRRGQFHVTFTDQSPLSPIEAQSRRYHIRVDSSHRYTLGDESFEAFVPEDYDPQQPYGLMVWINASRSGMPSKGWLPILTRNRLIWIGANNSGNDRGVGVRVGLALDAVQNLKKLYNIDELRIYASGVSGGGKISTILAVAYPDVFTGAIPMAGVAFYRSIPVPDRAGQIWPPEFDRPVAAMLDRAKQQQRFVFLTGSNDFNRDSIKGIYESGFLADGFKNVQYVEVPEMGHGVPDAKVVESAIQTLDAPLPAIAKEQFSKAQILEKSGKLVDAERMYEVAVSHLDESLAVKARARIAELQKKGMAPTSRPAGATADAKPTSGPATQARPLTKSESDEAAAQQLFSLADSYEQNRLYAQARQRLEKLLESYPNTKIASQARIALQRINSRLAQQPSQAR